MKAKKLLSLLLASLVLCLVAMPAFAAEEVNHFAASINTAVIGQKTSTLTATSAEPEKYTASVSDIYYWKMIDGKSTAYHPTADETFLAGVNYRVRVSFKLKDGYRRAEKGVTCEIEGYDGNSTVGTYTWEIIVTAKDKADDPAPADANKCPWCDKEHGSGFFERIIAWFHSILAKLFKR